MARRAKKRKSLQDRIKERKQQEFVARDDQVSLFRENLALELDDESRKFIFNIWGQGGVGKSTLLKRYSKIVEEHHEGGVAIVVNEAQANVVEVLARFAALLKEKGFPLKNFDKKYEQFKQKQSEIDADGDAPSGIYGYGAKVLTSTGFAIAKTNPVGAVAAHLLDEEAFTQRVSEYADFARRKFSGRSDDIKLVTEPIEVLTPIFFDDLDEICAERYVLLGFDTYEQTSAYLETWLLDLLTNRYGDISDELIIGIAGRKKLQTNKWQEYDHIIGYLPLEPFSEEEARAFLEANGVANKEVADLIIELSSRLPLLLATLAKEAPQSLDDVKDVTETAVERFLQWVDDPKKRQLAIDAALCRVINEDIIKQLVEAENAKELFVWLCEMPFISQDANGWKYHLVVREQLFKGLKRRAPERFRQVHQKMAGYYLKLRTEIASSFNEGLVHEKWRILSQHYLYHLLCSYNTANTSIAIEECIQIVFAKENELENWTAIIKQAGEEMGFQRLEDLGEIFKDFVMYVESDKFEEFFQTIIKLKNYGGLSDKSLSILLLLEGAAQYELGQLEKSLEALEKCKNLNPDLVEVYRGFGSIYLEEHDYIGALKAFDQAIELNAKDDWVHGQRGITLRAMERYEEALAAFEQAVELDVEYQWAYVQRGITFRVMERYEEALAALDRAIELDEEYKWAHVNKGWILRLMENYEEALAALDRVIALDDEYTWAHKERGVALRKMEKYEESLEAFERAIELNGEDKFAYAHKGVTLREMRKYEEALTALDRAIELDEEYKWAYEHRVITLLEMERYEEALAALDRAIELDEEYKWAHGQRGVTLREMERYEEALAALDRAIELDEESKWAVEQRGITLQAMKRYEEALAALDRAIGLDEEHKWAHEQRVIILLEMKRYEEALAALDRAIELDEEYKWAHGGRGITLRAMERYEEALAALDRAIELDEKDKWVHEQRGKTLREMERYEEALVAFDRAIELDEKYSWAYEQKALTLRKMKEYNRALRNYDLSIALQPDSKWAINGKGQTFHKLKRFDEAIEEFEKVLEMDFEYQWAVGNLGITYRDMERFEEAFAQFDKALEIDPQYEWAIESKLELLVWNKDFQRVMELVENWESPSRHMFFMKALAHYYGEKHEAGKNAIEDWYNGSELTGISLKLETAIKYWILDNRQQSKELAETIISSDEGVDAVRKLVEDATDEPFEHFLNIEPIADLYEYLKGLIENTG